MARIEFKGLEEYTAKLNRLKALSRDRVIGAAVYDGAKVMADAVKAELQALPTDDTHARGKKAIGPTSQTKQDLIEHMGISPIQDDNGFLNVKVGFDGYNGHPTEKYPKGRPVPMLARAVQSGTSWMAPNPFVKNARSKSRKAAIEAMKKRVEQEIEKIMN